MPRAPKRRADAISQDASASDSDDSTSNAPRRRRNDSPASASASAPASRSLSPTTQPSSALQTQIKKLVRLALSCDHARIPIRRTEITSKVLKSDGGTSRPNFRAVFEGAQKQIRDVFGMELIDLPTRERTTLTDRRKAATQKSQTQTQMQTQDKKEKDPVLSAQSWVLVSTLPDAYRHRVELVPRDEEYVALYSVVVAVLYLHSPSDDGSEPLSDAKLMRFLKRVDIENYVPLTNGRDRVTVDKFLARMIREGYIERRRDLSSGEEVVEWVVGPRGKREIGRKGVAGLVRGVYGFGVDGRGKGLELPVAVEDGDEGDEGARPPGRLKMERDELEKRLKRTLGDVGLSMPNGAEGNGVNGEHGDQDQQQEQTQIRDSDLRRSGRARRVE